MSGVGAPFLAQNRSESEPVTERTRPDGGTLPKLAKIPRGERRGPLFAARARETTLFPGLKRFSTSQTARCPRALARATHVSFLFAGSLEKRLTLFKYTFSLSAVGKLSSAGSWCEESLQKNGCLWPAVLCKFLSSCRSKVAEK